MRAKSSRYHLILSPPHGSDLYEYCPGEADSRQSQYSLAVTGNPVAAYSETNSFRCAAREMYSENHSLLSRSNRQLSQRPTEIPTCFRS